MACSFEQARNIVFGGRAWALAFAEGEMINSYEELVQLAGLEQHKGKKFLNIALVVMDIDGG